MPTRKNLRKELADKIAKEYFLEQSAAYFDELVAAGQNAPHGQFLNQVEAVVLAQGRELLRQSFEVLTQEAVLEAEKKKKRGTAKNAKRKKGIAATPRKALRPPSEE